MNSVAGRGAPWRSLPHGGDTVDIISLFFLALIAFIALMAFMALVAVMALMAFGAQQLSKVNLIMIISGLLFLKVGPLS